MSQLPSERPIAIITGASRRVGIGASIASTLAQAGWDIATTFWRPYDASMPWGNNSEEAESILEELRHFGSRTVSIEADLSNTDAPAQIFDIAEQTLGSVTALVMAHCQCLESNILNTSIESFDLHFAVNARATWLLVREFGQRYRGPHNAGRIVSITSDHTVENFPYGASKGAMDRIVLTSALEFGSLGITANVINPGATDTGWMSKDQMEFERRRTPLGRVGLPQDCANLVKFLCSKDGGWVNGQLLYSNGGSQ